MNMVSQKDFIIFLSPWQHYKQTRKKAKKAMMIKMTNKMRSGQKH